LGKYLLLLPTHTHFIKCLSSAVNPIIFKRVNMTPEWRHQ